MKNPWDFIYHTIKNELHGPKIRVRPTINIVEHGKGGWQVKSS